jgi:hypothetical protein
VTVTPGQRDHRERSRCGLPPVGLGTAAAAGAAGQCRRPGGRPPRFQLSRDSAACEWSDGHRRVTGTVTADLESSIAFRFLKQIFVLISSPLNRCSMVLVGPRALSDSGCTSEYYLLNFGFFSFAGRRRNIKMCPIRNLARACFYQLYSEDCSTTNMARRLVR